MKIDELYGNNELAKHVIKSKYLQPNEDDVDEMWSRVAKAAASVEKNNKDKIEKKFKELLEDFKMVPGGRILAGAGINDKISLTNCISGDSILTTESGKIKLKDIFNCSNYPKILTYDFNNGVNIFERPNNVILTKRAYPLILMFKDQRYIKCTEDHQFYVIDKGWVEAQNIEVGDCIYSEGRAFCDAKLEHKIHSDIEEDVYDVSMPTNHWFYANELLVHNCYASDIDDCIWEGEDKPSIYRTLLNHALTFKASGGTSANLSSLRPRGTPINNNINQESCGPVGFMELFSVNTATISAGRNRRGALLLGLRIDHPDILEFVNVKSDDDLKIVLSKVPEKDRQECWKLLNNYRSVSNANISVMITDEFMQAVQHDKEFSLRWAADNDYLINGVGTEYKKIKAKELWDIIMKSNYDNAEPGILFYDNIKKNFTTQYKSPFLLTNPSMPAGTKVHTDKGFIEIQDLEDKTFMVPVLSGEWANAKCFLSGENEETFEIKFNGNMSQRCTAKHKWPVLVNNKIERLETSQLRIGDKIPLNLNRLPNIDGSCKLGKKEGYLVGKIQGDGWLSTRENGTRNLGITFSKEERQEAEEMCDLINELIGDRIDNRKVNISEREHELYIQTANSKILEIVDKSGFVDKNNLPKNIWTSNDEFISGFIDGLFSSDGYIGENQGNIILTSSREKMIKEVQELLSFMGIVSNIYSSEHSNVSFPNHKKYDKIYKRYDLHISIGQAKKFTNIFNISSRAKSKKIANLLQRLNSVRTNNVQNFRVIKEINKSENSKVWDISVDHDQHVFPVASCYTGNCGEIPLPAHGNCNLSSINLLQYTDENDIKWDKLANDIHTAIRFLDNIIDYNIERHPLPQQKEAAKDIRRCGLGFMGLADVFIKLKIKYGSEESIELTDKISKFFAEESWKASIELAKEKGSFPAYDEEKFFECEFIQKLPEHIKTGIKKYGVRNSAVNSIQPTGSTSIIAQCSSGLEPIFNKGITLRRVRDEHDYEKFNEYKIGHPLLIALFDDAPELPDYVVDAYEVDPFSKIRLQAAIQRYFDGNISNTINLPKDFPQHLLSKIFMLGWQLGLRGVTVYRDGSRMGILEKVS